MRLRVHLALLLWITGCAEQALVVPASDWTIVPAERRAAIDKQHDADLAAARADLAAASASLAALPSPTVGPPAPPRPAAVDAEDRGREQTRLTALGRIRAAEAELLRRDRERHTLRVEAARARIAMIESQRELVRAQAVNRALPGDETYDSAPLRGQFSRAQQRWYALSARARAAHDAFNRAGSDLAATKEAYAQVMRNGAPPPLVPMVAEVDHPLQLELPGWRVSRGDIARRRGLRRLLDDVWTPHLRVAVTRLSPAGRPVKPAARAGDRATSAAEPGDGRSPVATERSAAVAQRSAATAERSAAARSAVSTERVRSPDAPAAAPVARSGPAVSTAAPPGSGSAPSRAAPAAIAVKPAVAPATPAVSAAKPVERTP